LTVFVLVIYYAVLRFFLYLVEQDLRCFLTARVNAR